MMENDLAIAEAKPQRDVKSNFPPERSFAPAPRAAMKPRLYSIPESKIQTTDTVAANLFKGRVVDKKENGIPNATVTTIPQKNSTITDANGYFTFQNKDSVLNATVNAVGYQANQMRLHKATDSQKVVLQEGSSALSEVVVVGYGTKRNKAASKVALPESRPEPEGGWSQFHTYVAKNIEQQKALGKSFPEGEVKLSFKLNKKGEPYHIKIEKSLCKSCDEEAIRLLKEGPKWKGKKGSRGEVVLKL
jgi:hypothetical protein